MIHISVTIRFTNCLTILLLNNFACHFLFSLGSCDPCSSTSYNFTFLHVMQWSFRSGDYQYRYGRLFAYHSHFTQPLKQLICLVRSHAFYMLILYRPIGCYTLSHLLLLTLDIIQDGCSFKHPNTSTSTYTTPSFITKELCLVTYVQQF